MDQPAPGGNSVMKTLALLIALCLGISNAATSTAAPVVSDADFNDARASFLKGSAGDSAATSKAAAQFAELLKRDPSNPLLIAYHGAAVAMRARDAWFPWRKMSYAEDGLAEIDRALAAIRPQDETTRVQGVPTAIQAKFVAANSYLAMPANMNRHAQGEKLLSDMLTSPAFAASPLGFRKAVYGTALRYLAAKNPQQVPVWQRELAAPMPNSQASAH